MIETMKAVALLLGALGCAGCAATASDVRKLQEGMTRDEVIQIMGNPGETRFLVLTPKGTVRKTVYPGALDYPDLRLILRDGKLAAGDFVHPVQDPLLLSSLLDGLFGGKPEPSPPPIVDCNGLSKVPSSWEQECGVSEWGDRVSGGWFPPCCLCCVSPLDGVKAFSGAAADHYYAERFERLEAGITRQQVQDILGDPPKETQIESVRVWVFPRAGGWGLGFEGDRLVWLLSGVDRDGDLIDVGQKLCQYAKDLGWISVPKG